MNKMEKRALAADGALLGCAVMWGGGFVAAKIALDSVTPLYVLALRVMGAGILMTLLFWKKIKTVDRATLKIGILLGMFLLVGQSLQIIGLQYTQPGKQGFLVASYTLLIPFVSWVILKRRPQLPAIIAGMVMLCGIGCLSLGKGMSIAYGDILSILSAVIFAVHMVVISMVVRKHDPLQLSILQLLVAGIIALILALIFEQPMDHISAESAWAMAYLLIINTAVASSVQNVAQKYTSPTHSSIILSLESLFSLIFAILVLGEIFTPRMLVGVALIFVALMISRLEKVIVS